MNRCLVDVARRSRVTQSGDQILGKVGCHLRVVHEFFRENSELRRGQFSEIKMPFIGNSVRRLSAASLRSDSNPAHKTVIKDQASCC